MLEIWWDCLLSLLLVDDDVDRSFFLFLCLRFGGSAEFESSS